MTKLIRKFLGSGLFPKSDEESLNKGLPEGFMLWSEDARKKYLALHPYLLLLANPEYAEYSVEQALRARDLMLKKKDAVKKNLPRAFYVSPGNEDYPLHALRLADVKATNDVYGSESAKRLQDYYNNMYRLEAKLGLISGLFSAIPIVGAINPTLNLIGNTALAGYSLYNLPSSVSTAYNGIKNDDPVQAMMGTSGAVMDLFGALGGTALASRELKPVGNELWNMFLSRQTPEGMRYWTRMKNNFADYDFYRGRPTEKPDVHAMARELHKSRGYNMSYSSSEPYLSLRGDDAIHVRYPNGAVELDISHSPSMHYTIHADGSPINEAAYDLSILDDLMPEGSMKGATSELLPGYRAHSERRPFTFLTLDPEVTDGTNYLYSWDSYRLTANPVRDGWLRRMLRADDYTTFNDWQENSKGLKIADRIRSRKKSPFYIDDWTSTDIADFNKYATLKGNTPGVYIDSNGKVIMDFPVQVKQAEPGNPIRGVYYSMKDQGFKNLDLKEVFNRLRRSGTSPVKKPVTTDMFDWESPR